LLPHYCCLVNHLGTRLTKLPSHGKPTPHLSCSHSLVLPHLSRSLAAILPPPFVLTRFDLLTPFSFSSFAKPTPPFFVLLQLVKPTPQPARSPARLLRPPDLSRFITRLLQIYRRSRSHSLLGLPTFLVLLQLVTYPPLSFSLAIAPARLALASAKRFRYRYHPVAEPDLPTARCRDNIYL
jgi:hypothetical protein